jgi:hypothetical protein
MDIILSTMQVQITCNSGTKYISVSMNISILVLIIYIFCLNLASMMPRIPPGEIYGMAVTCLG